MKFLIVFACVIVASQQDIPPEAAEQLRQTLMQYGEGCKAEAQTTDEDFEIIRNMRAPTTNSGKCFLSCMHKKLGWQTPDGRIDRDGIYAKFEEMRMVDEDFYQSAKQIADNCLNKVTDTPDECETGANLFVCLQEEREAAGIAAVRI